MLQQPAIPVEKNVFKSIEEDKIQNPDITEAWCDCGETIVLPKGFYWFITEGVRRDVSNHIYEGYLMHDSWRSCHALRRSKKDLLQDEKYIYINSKR